MQIFVKLSQNLATYVERIIFSKVRMFFKNIFNFLISQKLLNQANLSQILLNWVKISRIFYDIKFAHFFNIFVKNYNVFESHKFEIKFFHN